MVVNDDGYQLILGDVRTGKIHARVPYSSLKWGQRLNAAGAMAATLRPESRELARHDLRMLTSTVRQFMAVQYGDTILEAGPIWTRPTNKNTGELQINGLGLWSIFDRRKNIPGYALLPGAAVTEALITIKNRHPGSIARALVRTSIEDNPYGGDLPIVLPESIPGNLSKDYPGYDLSWLGDDLRELAKLSDLRFRPRFVEGDRTRIEWVMEHGPGDLLSQPGPDHRLDGRVERPGLSGLSVDQDGSGVGAMNWTPGSGQEQAMKLATSRDTRMVDAGYPWTEVETAAANEEDPDVLQALSDRALEDAVRPWDSWSIKVRRDRNPRVGSYLPGDWAQVNAPDGYPLSPSGFARVRIMAVDGDAGPEVSLAVAPVQGTDGGNGGVYSTALLPSPSLYPSPSVYPSTRSQK